MNQPEPARNPANPGGEANTIVDERVAKAADVIGRLLSEGSEEDILAAMTTLKDIKASKAFPKKHVQAE